MDPSANMAWISSLDWKLFFKRLYQKSSDTDIFSHSAQIAFYFSFAIFPLLFFLTSLLGIIVTSSDGIKREMYVYLYQIMPREVFELVRKTIDEIVVNSTGGKVTIGLLFTLWSASAGFDAVRTGLNGIYGLKETRPWWRTKLQSLVLTFIVTIVAGFLLAFVFYGWKLFGMVLAAAGVGVPAPWVLITIQWATSLGLVFFVCELIYNLLPNHGEPHWLWLKITPGSVVAIVLWIILSTGFRTYLAYYNSYNKAYGSLGAVIVMMLWLYLTASSLMIGGVINTIITELRTGDKHEDEV